MTSEIKIKVSRFDELSWINTQYDNVGFKHSVFDKELIAIAEVNGIKSGLGRLQHVEEKVVELRGMYVNEYSRGYGLPSKIVTFLLQYADSYNSIYCLPFSHLGKFYNKFGFSTAHHKAQVPQQVIEKHQWCNANYEQNILLFVLHKNDKDK
jgi:N-acetylglutamate synthase-like GNAT family acetyltransferase